MIAWTKKAEEALENLPLPPMLGAYARLECERLAKKNNLSMVTPEIVSQAEKNYGRAIGRDVMRKLRAMSEGSLDEPMVPDELFDDDSGELYSILLCPSQYGAASDIKIENMKILVPELRKKLKELQVTDLMMDLTETAVMPHCEFRVVLTGCTNACTSPYFSDFGVMGVYEVELIEEKCSGCGQCVDYCSRGVIVMKNGFPDFNKSRCIKCGGCEEFCPESAVRVKKMGYKVVAGGTGARFPKISQTVVEYTNLDGVLKTLEDIVGLIRDKHTPGRVFDISELVEEYRKSL